MMQRHTSAKLMPECLNTIAYLKKKIRSLPPEPQFLDPSEVQKMVNYYLLQWLQVLQHIPYTNTLNK